MYNQCSMERMWRQQKQSVTDGRTTDKVIPMLCFAGTTKCESRRPSCSALDSVPCVRKAISSESATFLECILNSTMITEKKYFFVSLGLGWTLPTYVSSGKVKKREISLFGLNLPKREILRETIPDINFVHHHSNSGWNFGWDIPYKWLKTHHFIIVFFFFFFFFFYSLQNSIQFTLFKGENDRSVCKEWGSKREIPTFRREMNEGLSLEGDLTCICSYPRSVVVYK